MHFVYTGTVMIKKTHWLNKISLLYLKKKIDWLFMKKGMFCLGTSSCCRPLVLRTRRPSLKTKLYTVNKIGNQFKQRAYWQKWQTVRKLTHCQKNEKKVYPNARLEKSIEHISASIAPIKWNTSACVRVCESVLKK